MEQPSTPENGPASANIISQEEFDRCAAQWLEVGSDATGSELAKCFQEGKGGTRLTAVSFPVLHIVELVSAVGVRNIKARFLVMRDEKKPPHFTVALYATDAQDARLTSYYLAERYWLLQADPASTPIRVEIADVLARHWTANWANAEKYPITPALFASGYGPLRGYTFEVSDFMKPLLPLSALGTQRLMLDLGLHTYFSPGPQGDAPTATFGLVLRMTGLGAQAGEVDPSYDMAQPCPPTC